jgi:uncharacterized protein
MNAISLLESSFNNHPEAFKIVLEHSRLVTDKALAIAKSISNCRIDFHFIEEAALLHDIGVSRIHSPKIGCYGQFPYICHGILGREILEAKGHNAHGLVCERHIGVGIGIKDIVQQQLPLPKRDMIPVSVEEKIICFADLFYSKRPGLIRNEKTVDEIIFGLRKHGSHKVAIFLDWCREFSV